MEVRVTGTAAANIDLTNFLGRRVLVFFGVVLSLSFVLLLMVFRSLLVPLKAVIMNVLAMTATYGVVVAVFQWGWGGDLLDIAGAPIEPFIPLILFAIVVGTSSELGRLAFQTLMQRLAPGGSYGRVFVRYEVLFQLAWVGGALIPALAPIDFREGFLILAALYLVAIIGYLTPDVLARRRR